MAYYIIISATLNRPWIWQVQLWKPCFFKLFFTFFYYMKGLLPFFIKSKKIFSVIFFHKNPCFRIFYGTSVKRYFTHINLADKQVNEPKSCPGIFFNYNKSFFDCNIFITALTYSGQSLYLNYYSLNLKENLWQRYKYLILKNLCIIF